MLDCIDRQQRNKLKLDNLSLPSPERHRPLRHQFSSDNMHVPPFNIPNLRIDQRKTSSAEDMARKNSTGSIRKFIPRLFYVYKSSERQSLRDCEFMRMIIYLLISSAMCWRIYFAFFLSMLHLDKYIIPYPHTRSIWNFHEAFPINLIFIKWLKKTTLREFFSF